MSKVKITKIMYDAYKTEEEFLIKSIEDAIKRRNDSAAEGDLSENASHTKAKEDLQDYKLRKLKITEILDNADVIEPSTSEVLDNGSYINITKCDKNGNPLDQPELFLLDSIERYLCGFIGLNSPIGRRILGNPSGIFDVTVNGHTNYFIVQKLYPTEEIERKFRDTYPITMDGIFDV